MTAVETLPKSHAQLLEAIHTSGLTDEQRCILAPLVDEVCEETIRRKRILSLVQEAIEELRLGIKYTVFDLEATRRERDERKPI